MRWPVYNHDQTISDDWTEVPLAGVSRRRRGYSWAKEQEAPLAEPGAFPVIRIPNIGDDLDLSDLLYLRNVSNHDVAEFAVEKDWILYVSSNGNPDRIGDSVFLRADKPMLFASFLQAITTKTPDTLLPEFLALWLKLHSVHEIFSKTSQQTTGLANFSWSAVKQLPVRFPVSIKHQRAIVRVLRSADDAIKSAKTEHEKARRLKTGLLQELFTKGLPARPHSLSRSKWLICPSHWNHVQLRRIAKIEAGFTMGRDLGGRDTVEVPYLTVVNVLEGRLSLNEVSSSLIEVGELDTGLLAPGDVLMTEGGDRDKLGRGCIWRGEIERCAYQNHIFRVRFNPDTLRPLLFHFLLQSYQARRYFFSHAKQTSNLCTINSRELKRFEVPVPPAEEQKEMVNILEAAEESIRSAERKIVATERVKRSMLQNLLTGRIRLLEATAA
jgi:type I restriction enzyme S subunit